MEIQSKEELFEKLNCLGDMSEEQRNSITCTLIGHSRIQGYCFGEYYCSRCNEKVGDSLVGSYYDSSTVVVVGHDCDICRDNYKTLTWKDKVFCPNPFPDRVIHKSDCATNNEPAYPNEPCDYEEEV